MGKRSLPVRSAPRPNPAMAYSGATMCPAMALAATTRGLAR